MTSRRSLETFKRLERRASALARSYAAQARRLQSSMEAEACAAIEARAAMAGSGLWPAFACAVVTLRTRRADRAGEDCAQSIAAARERARGLDAARLRWAALGCGMRRRIARCDANALPCPD